MGRIAILNDDVIDKIAAGEVVERPASVVKELVENAVDAGAHRIEVGLELGGSRRITVQDDGCGMSEDDARLALRRHATSKIRSSDDLFRIATMGFRGEALAAIASVSRMTLASREIGSAVGVKLQNTHGDTFQALPWHGPEGTTISVEQLFYNVPVRAKFLKSPATELGHVQELMQALALCHPQVSFVLSHNGREIMRAPSVQGDLQAEDLLRSRVRTVLGAETESKLIFVSQSNRFGSLVGLVSPPGVEKPTAKAVLTFVNGRPVKDRVFRFAVMRGYHSHLLKGRYPVAVLYLQTDPSLVDVNVHPAKTEVRFQYPDEVQSLISLAIRECLRDATWAGPSADTPVLRAGASASLPQEQPTIVGDRQPRDSTPASLPSSSGSSELVSPSVRVTKPLPRLPTATGTFATMESVSDARSIQALLARQSEPLFGLSISSSSPPSPSHRSSVPWEDLEFIGSFDRCYLFFEMPGQMLVVDQHAFHERIIYERLMRDGSLLRRSQPLLVPEAIELDVSSCARIAANQKTLAERGFTVTMDGPTSLTCSGVPTLLARADLGRLFAELAARLPESTAKEATEEATRELEAPLLATFACHAAVRAGEDLGEDERKRLLSEAKSVDFYHNCPHGRRVFRWFPRDVVAAWFDR